METLESLTEGAYAAALDDALWPSWSERLIDAVGGAKGTFVVLDATTGAVRRQLHLRWPPQVIEQYQNLGLGALDPQMPYARRFPAKGYYLDTDHLDRSDPGTAEFTRWMNGNAGVDHYLTLGARLDAGRVSAGLSIWRDVADGATPTVEQQKIEALLPEVTRAMQLGFANAEKLLDSYWSGLQTQRAEPTLLLDDEGRALRLTDSLVAVCARDGAIDLVGGRLRAAGPVEDARLQAMLDAAVAPGRPRSGAMRVAGPSGRAPLVVTVYPLPRARRALAPAEAAALVTVIDPTGATPAPAQLWRDAFDFTARECEVAVRLMAGHSVESAATSLAITEATTRVHLRRLLAKTDTARQSELLRLLSRMG